MIFVQILVEHLHNLRLRILLLKNTIMSAMLTHWLKQTAPSRPHRTGPNLKRRLRAVRRLGNDFRRVSMVSRQTAPHDGLPVHSGRCVAKFHKNPTIFCGLMYCWTLHNLTFSGISPDFSIFVILMLVNEPNKSFSTAIFYCFPIKCIMDVTYFTY